jgi:hypothetical protein
LQPDPVALEPQNVHAQLQFAVFLPLATEQTGRLVRSDHLRF